MYHKGGQRNNQDVILYNLYRQHYWIFSFMTFSFSSYNFILNVEFLQYSLIKYFYTRCNYKYIKCTINKIYTKKINNGAVIFLWYVITTFLTYGIREYLFCVQHSDCKESHYKWMHLFSHFLYLLSFATHKYAFVAVLIRFSLPAKLKAA